MLKRSLHLAPLLLLVLSLPALADGPAGKIAVVNPARIFKEMQETKDLQKKWESDGEAITATQKEKKAKLDSLQEARDQLRADSPQFQQRNKEFLQAQIEAETWVRITQSDVQRTQKQQIKMLFDKIQSAVGRAAKQRGFEVVIADQSVDVPDLEKIDLNALQRLLGQRNVMFVDEKNEISSDVIALLDADYKAKK